MVGRHVHSSTLSSPTQSDETTPHGSGTDDPPSGELSALTRDQPERVEEGIEEQGIEEQFITYVVSNTNISRADAKRLWAALIDRGANGWIAGDDVRLIEWCADQPPVNVTGIQAHTVKKVPIGNFGGVTTSQRGEIIVVINQGAHLPGTHSIISALQMEAYKCEVNEKSHHISGELPKIITPEGYIIPLAIRNGLPYMKLRPFTDEEFERPPKVSITADAPWDPSKYDAMVPDNWKATQPMLLERLAEDIFDQRGQYIVDPEDEDTDGGDTDPETSSEDEGVDDGEVRVYLHKLVEDELDDKFELYELDGEWHEHIDHDERIRTCQAARRSKRLQEAAKKSGTKTHRKTSTETAIRITNPLRDLLQDDTRRR